MADFLAWSHSRLSQFRECPKKLWHSALAPKGSPDRLEFVQSQAMLDGLEIDNALTSRVAKATPLPPKYAQWERLMGSIVAAPGVKLTQLKVALDRAFKVCGYTDWNNTWVRAVYDLAIVNGTHAFIWDWKAGQIRLDENQLRLFAATGFHFFPEVDTIDTSYIWLKHGVTSDAHYTRRELPAMWDTFTPDVERMQISYKTNQWPPTPSPSACKWCDVNKAGKCPVAAVKHGSIR